MSCKQTFFGLNFGYSIHMSNVRKNKDIIKKENCICPKSENYEDLIIKFFVYVQMTEINLCRDEY